MRHSTIFALALVAATMPALGQEADPVAGKTAFAPCSSCHDVSESRINRMGPYLTGVVGRPAASVEKFTYSQAMVAARDAGLVWTPESLDGFLQGPKEYVPGTKMPEIKVSDATARANLIAYLASLSPDFDPATQISTYTPPGAAGAAPAAGAPSAASSAASSASSSAQ